MGPLKGRVEVRLGRCVEVGLAPLSSGQAQTLLQLAASSDALRGGAQPEVVEVISDRARVRSLLLGLAESRARATLWTEGVGQEFLLRSEGEHLRMFPVELGQGSSARLEVEGYNSIYRLMLPQLTRRGWREATAPLPTQLVRVRRRRVRRVRVDAGWKVVLTHPLWPGLVIERPVVDLAVGGLSFHSSPEEDLLFPGLRLPELAVETPAGLRLRLCGEVRTLRSGRSGGPVCSLRVRAHDVVGSERWQRAVQRQALPAVEPWGDDLAPMWPLFEASGYFHLGSQSGAQAAALRADFERSALKAARAPHLFDQVRWLSARGVEASVSMFKPYRGTWIGHQLAKRADGLRGRENRRALLRDLYTAVLERPWAFPGFNWFAAYVEPTVSFMEQSTVAFCQRHEASGRALVLRFAFMEASCAETEERVPACFNIGPPTLAELDAVAAGIAARRPKPYLDALDLSRDHLDLGEASQAWRQAGLERERGLLVARDPAGRPCAVAVLEVAEPGTNLFRLLDSARVFALAEGGEAAFSELLDRARAWFRARGRERYLYFREHPSEEHALRAGLRPLSGPALCLWAAELTPDFIEFVFERTGSRPAGAKPNPQAEEKQS
jgi:hypothetical protein